MTKCIKFQKDFQSVGASPDPVSLFGACCNTCANEKNFSCTGIFSDFILNYYNEKN